MEILPKTLFVGPPKLGAALAKNRADLDFVEFVEDIPKLWEGLENETIDSEIDVLFTIDSFFQPNGDRNDLEHMIAMLSPHCLFIVVQYNPKFENLLRERIRTAASNIASTSDEEDDYHEEDVEYYFISREHPNKGIDEARTSYITNHPDSNVSFALQGIDRERFEREQEESRRAAEFKEAVPGVDIIEDEEEEEEDRNGKVVAVTSSKGGTGVTTISALMTAYISHATAVAAKKDKNAEPAKVCLVDLNLRNGQLGFVIGALQPSVLKMYSEGVTYANLKDTAIYSENLQADCIVLPQKPRLANNLPLEFFGDLLEILKRYYDYVILDVPAGFVGMELDLVERLVYPTADLIVYVTDCSSTSLLSMARWIETVKAPLDKDGMDIPVEKLGVVVNDYIPDIGISGERIAKMSRGLPVITATPSNRKLAIKAINHQSSQAMLKDEAFKDAIGTLAVAVVGERHPMSSGIFD